MIWCRLCVATLGIGLCSSGLAQVPQWRFRELVQPPNTTRIFFGGLNNTGHIVTKEINRSTGAIVRNRVIYPNGFVRVLPNLPNTTDTFDPQGITDNGKIYGFRGFNIPCVYDIVTNQYTSYPRIGGNFVRTIVMNESGEAAIERQGTFPPDISDLIYMNQAGQYTSLYGSTYGDLVGINNAGYMVGSAGGQSFLYAYHPFIWSPGGVTATYLSSPNQLFGRTMDINELGEVLGIVSKSGPNPGWYSVWWNQQGQVLRERFMSPFQAPTSYPYMDEYYYASMNDRGAMTYKFRGRGRYYSMLTGDIDLTAHVTGLPSGMFVSHAGQLNNLGMMTVGLAATDGSSVFLGGYLEPVPEPATLAALGVGVVALLRRRKARRH